MSGLKEDDHSNKKRKLNDGPEIEIDVSAPEPPSKKALRKAKKKGTDSNETTTTNDVSQTETSKSSDRSKSSKRSEFGVWIGNLPFTATNEDIHKFLINGCTFSDTTITRIHLPAGASRGNGIAQNKGFAYVDFTTQKAMEEAIGLSEQFIAGRRVLIKGAQNFAGRPEEHQQAGSAKAAANGKNAAAGAHPPSHRIFVGNLGFDATKEAVEEHFAPCGGITNVHLATFEDSGKCKGYGWVEFETVEAAQHAVNGFVKVPEDDDEEEEEDDDDDSDKSSSATDDDKPDDEEESKKKKTRKSAAQKKKPKMRKVWVNRLLGRQLRMEFAEDAATRYKKRFGKEGTKGRENENGASEDATGVQGHRGRNDRRPKKVDSRYSEDTVQRLTGAIVEAQGKKVTFD